MIRHQNAAIAVLPIFAIAVLPFRKQLENRYDGETCK
jgi:hypothetical protein